MAFSLTLESKLLLLSNDELTVVECEPSLQFLRPVYAGVLIKSNKTERVPTVGSHSDVVSMHTKFTAVFFEGFQSSHVRSCFDHFIDL